MHDAFARATSAAVSAEVIEHLAQHIVQNNSSRMLEYQMIFGIKDINRAESSTVCWWMTFQYFEVWRFEADARRQFS